MHSRTKPVPARWPGLGAFCIGIAFIVAATMLNIAHDRLPGFKPEKLPLFIGDLYASSGKLGVTIYLVSLGILALIVGMCLRTTDAHANKNASGQEPSVADSRPYFFTSKDSEPVTHSSGRLVLETWKYVTPPNGRPGAP